MDGCDQIFKPSLNQQRYDYVIQLIKQTNSRIIADVGCGECNLIERIKFCCSDVEKIYGIDVDKATLEFNMYKTEPLICDGLYPREKQLETMIFHGNIECYDSRISNCDLLCAIEVIEHLYNDQIINFSDTIFKYINPNIVILSTPNSEFNVVFKNGLKGNKYRHPDHKFEWTRSEFEHYCKSVISQYNYRYKITGVGRATSKRYINIGFCTQIAIFYKCSNNHYTDYDPHVVNYELISWQYFNSLDEKFNNLYHSKIQLIEDLITNGNHLSYHFFDTDTNFISLNQFFNKNKAILNEYFVSIQILYDFLHHHTQSLIKFNGKSLDNVYFVFKRKPTPIKLSIANNIKGIHSDSTSSSSSSLSNSPLLSADVVENIEEFWD